MRIAIRTLLPLATFALASGCASSSEVWKTWRSPGPDQAETDSETRTIDPAAFERAHAERSEFLEREVARLRGDLQLADDSIVKLESGRRDQDTMADAVSAVAEARIALDRVSERVPWRRDLVAEAYAKLDEADRQLTAHHLGAAVFFASRVQRITEALRAETEQIAHWDQRRVVRGERVNLRSGPSEDAKVVEVLASQTPVFPERTSSNWTLVRTPDGQIGWVHVSLLRRP